MKKLDMRGITHDVVAIAFVVVFAIGGIAYLVASHADSCSSAASGPTSSPVTSVACITASGPVAGQDTLSGTCALSGVPTNPSYGQQISPNVTFTNTGTIALTPNAIVNVETFGDSGDRGGKGGPVTAPALGLRQSVTVSTGFQYTVPYSSASTRRLVFSVISSNPKFSCPVTTTLPLQAQPSSTSSTTTNSTSPAKTSTTVTTTPIAGNSPTSGSTTSNKPSGTTTTKAKPVAKPPVKKRNVVQSVFHWFRYSLF